MTTHVRIGADADVAVVVEGAQSASPPRSRRRSITAKRDYGLWLDPAVQDDPVYAEHWAGHRPVEVTIEEDMIVIRRAGTEESDDSDGDSDADSDE